MRTEMRQSLVSVAEQTGLSLPWSQILEDRFSRDVAQFDGELSVNVAI